VAIKQDTGKYPALEGNVASLFGYVKQPENFTHHKVETQRQNVAKLVGNWQRYSAASRIQSIYII